MTKRFRNRIWSLIEPKDELPGKTMVDNFQNSSAANLPGTITEDVVDSPQSKNLINTYPIINKISNWEKVTYKPPPPTMETRLFRNNHYTIDFVLAYEDDTPEKQQRRNEFQKNLVEEGLEIEIEDKKDSKSGDTYFVKVHVPWDLLCRYAEILKLKKPTRRENPYKWNFADIFPRLGMKNPFMYDEELIPPPSVLQGSPQVKSSPSTITRHLNIPGMDEDDRLERSSLSGSLNLSTNSKLNLLTLPNKNLEWHLKRHESYFTQTQRILIVWEILKRVRFSSSDHGFGITRLLANGSYVAAFPLHDGPYEVDIEGSPKCDRRILYLEWSRGAKWYKNQPIHLVRQYFGDKMALYFAWLGFYTSMLIPASIFGIFTFIVGFFFMNSNYNKPSQSICDEHKDGHIVMCPVCEGACEFYELEETCFWSKIAFLFDNPMTVVFATGMSIWAMMYMEMWKRFQVVIQWQWDMEDVEEEEELRPEFEEGVRTSKVNPKTGQKEPFLPFRGKCTRFLAANSVVLLMILLVVAAAIGVIVYQLIVETVMFTISKEAKLITSLTAGVLNLLVIITLSYFYEKIVDHLTELEMPRTEREFEDSFTLKMFLFECVNYYSSLIYIAFFKGRFFYQAGHISAKHNVFLEMRYDRCDEAGCIFELCVHLAIIMVGEQFLSNGVELFIPVFKVWWNKRQTSSEGAGEHMYPTWEKNYDLTEFTRLSLFGEYVEMAIQYGFVVLFVAAFPLAPFFALLNNIVEIRLDAYKYVTKIRRPVPQRGQDIGIWFGILRCITYASVVANALVIAFTSDFIPRLVYIMAYSQNYDLEGYVTHSLSVFNVSNYGEDMGPDKKKFPKEHWPEVCHYQGFRQPLNNATEADYSILYWQIVTARLGFIIIFVHVIFITTALISCLMPDATIEVKNQMKIELKEERDALFKAEMQKTREKRLKFTNLQNHMDLEQSLFHTPNDAEGRPPSQRSDNRSPTPE